MQPDSTTLVSITDHLAHVFGGESAPAPANPFHITPDMLKSGMVQTGATTFQPVNCVKLSQALPNAPAALSDSYVCTATEPPRSVTVQ